MSLLENVNVVIPLRNTPNGYSSCMFMTSLMCIMSQVVASASMQTATSRPSYRWMAIAFGFARSGEQLSTNFTAGTG